MSVDWSNGAVGAAGGVLAAVAAFILGRGDAAQQRRRDEIARESVLAVRESKEFVLQASQQEINRELSEDVKEVKATVTTFDKKLDALLLSGRIPIKRPDEESRY